MPGKFKDYYQLLGVPKNASRDEIRDAFRAKAKETHPDATKDPNGEEKFKEINEAWSVLGKTDTRSEYDEIYNAFQRQRKESENAPSISKQRYKSREGYATSYSDVLRHYQEAMNNFSNSATFVQNNWDDFFEAAMRDADEIMRKAQRDVDEILRNPGSEARGSAHKPAAENLGNHIKFGNVSETDKAELHRGLESKRRTYWKEKADIAHGRSPDIEDNSNHIVFGSEYDPGQSGPGSESKG